MSSVMLCLFFPFAIPKSPLPCILLHLRLIRQKITLDSKHLPGSRADEPIDLLRVLLHLPSVQHRLQPTGLSRQLEQPLPLVLGQQRLLQLGTCGVFRFTLGLPGADLGLFAGKGALVVLEVVVLGVVDLEAVEEEVAVFL